MSPAIQLLLTQIMQLGALLAANPNYIVFTETSGHVRTVYSALRPPFRNPPPYNPAVAENTAAFNEVTGAELRPNMVNHPPHYTRHPSGVECIEVAEHLPFCLGNAFKYLFRRDHKNTQRQDLEKALWYINRERDYRLDTDCQYLISEEAVQPLREICDHEPAPYRHIMEMVGSGRMLDLAAQMLADLLDQH